MLCSRNNTPITISTIGPASERLYLYGGGVGTTGGGVYVLAIVHPRVIPFAARVIRSGQVTARLSRCWRHHRTGINARCWLHRTRLIARLVPRRNRRRRI